MTTCFLAPDPIQDTFLIPGSNTPGNGVQLFCYAAGSSTKSTVYKDNAAASAWTNPIVLDSGGNLPSGATVWIPTGVSMKFVYAPSNDTDPPASPYRTLDNYAGINDTTSTQSEWVSGPTPTFVSSTQFTLVGDQTATFTVGRRLKTTNTAGTVYSTIVSASFGANTTVNVVSDGSGALDAGLSAVSYGLFDPANPSISASEVNRKGPDVASAGNGTTNIWGTVGDYAHITGTNTINFFSSAPYAGAVKDLVFDGALQLNSSAAMLINGNQNVTTSANDRARVRAETVSTYAITFFPISGQPYGSATSSQLLAGPSSGAASNLAIRNFKGSDAGDTLLASTTASSSASLSFTSGSFDWTAYDKYRFEFNNLIPATNGTGFLARVSLNGTTFTTSPYLYAFSAEDSANSAQSAGTSAASGVWMTVAVGNSIVGGGISGVAYINNPSTANSYKHIHGQIVCFDSANLRTATFGGVFNGTSSPVQGIQFLFGSGNINTGTLYAFGVRKS